MNIYRASLGLVNLDSARRSQIDLMEEHHSQIGKGDDEDRFGKVVASPNSPNLTTRGIAPISPFSPPPLLQIGLLRRKLRAEFYAMREKIAESGLRDEMTLEIKAWQEKFSAALNISPDEERVCNTYIRLLQELLIDPITDAPLDAHAVIGSDGQTYGQMSLSVYRYSIPAEYRNRPPLDISNPAPFRVAPHSVVRHMIGWLGKHNAMLYSEALERAYLRLLPSQQTIDREASLNRIMARQQVLDRIEAGRRSDQIQAFDQRLSRRMQAWGAELERPASLRPGTPVLQSPTELEAASSRLGRVAANDQRAYRNAEENLDRSSTAERLRLEEVQQQLHLSQHQESIAIAQLQTAIVEHLGPSATSLIERLNAHANATLAKVRTTALKEEEAFQILEHSIQKLNEKITALEEQNLDLEEKIDHTSHQVDAAKQEEISLQKGIHDTQVAIQKLKKKKKERLLSTITQIGICAFSTWVLYSTRISGGIIPEQGGARISLKIRI